MLWVSCCQLTLHQVQTSGRVKIVYFWMETGVRKFSAFLSLLLSNRVSLAAEIFQLFIFRFIFLKHCPGRLHKKIKTQRRCGVSLHTVCFSLCRCVLWCCVVTCLVKLMFTQIVQPCFDLRLKNVPECSPFFLFY